MSTILTLIGIVLFFMAIWSLYVAVTIAPIVKAQYYILTVNLFIGAVIILAIRKRINKSNSIT